MRTQKYHSVVGKRAGYNKPLSRLRLYVFAAMNIYKSNNKIMDNTNHTWASVNNSGQWDKNPQIYLGNIQWSDAIAWVDLQSEEVRLCHSSGYNNQGHYIQPNPNRNK